MTPPASSPPSRRASRRPPGCGKRRSRTMALDKIRAGMGDVESASVEVWSDADEARARGLLQVLAPEGKLVGAAPKLEPAFLRELHRAMLRARVLDEKMLNLQRQGRIAFYAEAR